MQFCSQMEIDGAVLYLVTLKMHVPDALLATMEKESVEIGFTYVPTLTVDDANKQLCVAGDTGTDWRSRKGDFVTIRQGRQLWMVESSAYNWRTKVHGEEPNHAFRFHQLSNYAMEKNYKTDRMTYLNMFPGFSDADGKDLSAKKAHDTLERRLWNVYQTLMHATSKSHHPEMLTLYKDYVEGKAKVEQFLIQLVYYPQTDTKGMYIRAPQIAQYVRNYCYKFAGTVEYQNRVQYGVQSALLNEEGGSLYKLIQCANGKRQVERGQSQVSRPQYQQRGQNSNHRFNPSSSRRWKVMNYHCIYVNTNEKKTKIIAYGNNLFH